MILCCGCGVQKRKGILIKNINRQQISIVSKDKQKWRKKRERKHARGASRHSPTPPTLLLLAVFILLFLSAVVMMIRKGTMNWDQKIHHMLQNFMTVVGLRIQRHLGALPVFMCHMMINIIQCSHHYLFVILFHVDSSACLTSWGRTMFCFRKGIISFTITPTQLALDSMLVSCLLPSLGCIEKKRKEKKRKEISFAMPLPGRIT